MYRTVEALEEYNQIIKKSQVESVYVLGTKALRKADLNTMIRRRCVLHRRYG